MGQGFSLNTLFNGTPVLTTSLSTTGGISTFAAGQLLQYGAAQFLGGSGGISQSATTPTVTTTANHGLVTGQWVTFQNLYETSSTGMQQIAGIPFQVTVTGATTFTFNWNNSGGNYAAITAGGFNTLASFKQILYPSLYVPGTSFIAGITGNVVTTTAAHNFQIGQEVAFRIPTVWGPSQLNSLPDPLIPGSPVYYYVTAVTVNTITLAHLPVYTAFNSNQAFASFPGEFFPQVVAVGDLNSGGWQYTGGNLYPSPQVYSNSLSLSSTINGPAIQGAYVNNTSQGFFFGVNAAPTAAQQIFWEALLVDYAVN